MNRPRLPSLLADCAEAVSLGVVVSCAQAQCWGDVVAAAKPCIFLGGFAAQGTVLLFTCITSSQTCWAESDSAANGVVLVIQFGPAGVVVPTAAVRNWTTLGVSSANRERAGCEGCANSSCGVVAAAANVFAQCVFSTCGQRTKSAGVLDVVVVTGTSGDAASAVGMMPVYL